MFLATGWTLYNRWLVGGRTGQSLGKRVTKIRLVSELTDAPIGPMNAFLRDLVHILDGMAYVGFLWPLWDDNEADVRRQDHAHRRGHRALTAAPTAGVAGE